MKDKMVGSHTEGKGSSEVPGFFDDLEDGSKDVESVVLLLSPVLRFQRETQSR